MDIEKKNEYICLKRQQYFFSDYSLAVIQKTDIEDIRQWRNAQLQVLRQATPIGAEEQEEYFRKFIWPAMAESQPQNILLTFFWRGERIGYGGLVHIDWPAKIGELSFLLNPLHLSVDSYAKHFRAFLDLIFEITFDDLNFNKIFSETYSFRTDHVAILEKAGFKLKKTIKNSVSLENQSFDSLIHEVSNQEYYAQR